MPRHVDPEVEGRILAAARRLWHKGGEKALNMRAVATAAKTNTPAVYRRFRTREDILRALVQSYQLEFLRTLEACHSLPEMVQRFLEFGLSRPREYQLLMSGLLGRMTKSRPTLEFAVRRSAEWLGGSPADNRGLVLVLGALAHGTAMLKITGVYSDEDLPALQAAFSKAVDLLVTNSLTFRSQEIAE